MAKFKKGDRAILNGDAAKDGRSTLFENKSVVIDEENSRHPWVFLDGGRWVAWEGHMTLEDCPFKVGDRIKPSLSCTVAFLGPCIFKAEVHCKNEECFAVERENGSLPTGGGLWPVHKSFLKEFELVESAHKYKNLELVPPTTLDHYGLSTDRLISYQELDRVIDILNQPTKKSFFMDIVDKIKFAALKPTDKILRTEGLEDENGKMTDQAHQMMGNELSEERWLARREAVAADIKAVRDEEKE